AVAGPCPAHTDTTTPTPPDPEKPNPASTSSQNRPVIHKGDGASTASSAAASAIPGAAVRPGMVGAIRATLQDGQRMRLPACQLWIRRICWHFGLAQMTRRMLMVILLSRKRLTASPDPSPPASRAAPAPGAPPAAPAPAC